MSRCPSPTLGVETLRVCGVPEHFNLPWTLGVKKRVFDGVANVRWTAVPGGTGAMVSAVAEGHQDVALALTEGIVAAAIASRDGPTPLCYAGSYVTSPLCWMVVCASGREDAPASLAELGARARDGECIRVSVSRLGSGSHIMAYLLAMREGWPLRNLTFVKNENFRNMRKGALGVCRGCGGAGLCPLRARPLRPLHPSASPLPPAASWPHPIFPAPRARQPSATARLTFSCGKSS